MFQACDDERETRDDGVITFGRTTSSGGNDNVQFEIDDFFIELNLALQCNVRSIKHIGNRLCCRRNQWRNFRHYSHNFVFLQAPKLIFFLVFFLFIFIERHKNYHFHKLQAIIVTRCFTSQFHLFHLILLSALFDFLVLDDDFLGRTRWPTS